MAERKTSARAAMILAIGLAASVKVEAGKMAVINALGYGAEGAEGLGLKYIGRWRETADNSAGDNGAVVAEADFDQAFQWANSATDAVDQSCVGKVVFIEDDETVSKTSNDLARSPAGLCLGVDSDGVWVLPALPNTAPAVVASGVHVWGGGAAKTDSIDVAGLAATDVVLVNVTAQGSANPTSVIGVVDVAGGQIDLTLDQNGEDAVTKVSYAVIRA